ncbi:MAG: D-alanyl-D-alanine carboxypeptidase family protein [Candidatus Moranbacteria bacterium]|nr:D-alanyl-D-alanine carboxypeptidase family protein [Candidatus Moranbacteria bacterium]
MNNKTKIKYSFFALAVLGASSWFFVSPSLKSVQSIFNQKEKSEKALEKNISVKGAEAGEFENSANITFEQLLMGSPEAPRKIEEFGNFYVRGKASIVLDAETGTILHYQNARERRAIASLTKIMTAIVVLEEIDDLKNEVVTISRSAAFEIGTKVGCPNSGYCISNRLRVGEEISAWNLFQAMVMNSANDAAVALAEHVAGSEKEFAKLMNKKAEELGLRDTHFCNPSGLDEDDNPGGCYSTAYDIARIAVYSLKYDEIWDTMKIDGKEIYSADGEISHRLINTDLLLDQMPNCTGGKTGFTYEAGKSLMTGAHHPQDKDIQVIGVILDDYYRWQDMKNLMKWTFQAYRWPEDI